MSILVPFDKFEEVFENLVANQTKAIILFVSQKNKDGTYWCPNCQKIAHLLPTIEAQARKINLSFYVFVVGDKPTWKDPQNKMRKHKLTLLKSIPTLGLFDGRTFARNQDSDQILDDEKRALIYE